MNSRLNRQFYLKSALVVAKDLLGQYLVHQIGAKKIIGKIIETEAYPGPQDLASHARHNKITPRNLAEYMIGGHIYIYLVYGMYWQLNISTGLSGRPACVLIRAVEPPSARIDTNISAIRGRIRAHSCLTNGPGKLCRYLKINQRHYGLDLVTSHEVWLERGEKILAKNIAADQRIGIDYAGQYWANKKWR
ncbi:MAG: DNA-3-methyladenine glycosylase, partial [Candidatus Parcubacteria bacterium]|nr:DNA-3-methyladenine glycosylase [Candidatus Parcubacteria bacterium]